MTAYTTITDGEIDPESPITTTLMTKMRDNAIAITEGSSGAPKMQTAGITDNAVTADKLAAGIGVTELIESWTPTAVATKEFTWDESIYSSVSMVVDGIAVSTDNAFMYIRFGYDNGATIVITSNYKRTHGNTNSGTLTNVTTTLWEIATAIGNAAGEGASASLEFYGGGNAGRPTPHLKYTSTTKDTAGAYNGGFGWGAFNSDVSALSIDTLQLKLNTGTFQSGVGEVYLYGVRRA